MYQLCGPAWERALGSLGPADSCVLSGSRNAGGRPVWPLHPNSPGQNQVALVGPRAGGKREHQMGSRIPVKVWDDWKTKEIALLLETKSEALSSCPSSATHLLGNWVHH